MEAQTALEQSWFDKVALHKASYAATFMRAVLLFINKLHKKRRAADDTNEETIKLCDQNTLVMRVLGSKTDDTHIQS